MDDRQSRVLERLAELLGRELSPSDRLRDTAFDDSLDLVELLIGIKGAFGVCIPTETALRLETVGDVAAYLAEHAPASYLPGDLVDLPLPARNSPGITALPVPADATETRE